VCVCACVLLLSPVDALSHYAFPDICVCVCVFERESACVRVYVCACVCACVVDEPR